MKNVIITLSFFSILSVAMTGCSFSMKLGSDSAELRDRMAKLEKRVSTLEESQKKRLEVGLKKGEEKI
jgi:hypothetical protein